MANILVQNYSEKLSYVVKRNCSQNKNPQKKSFNSLDYNPWRWLTSQSAAEAMAEEVAAWFDKYNVDGIDLDIEEGAGSKPDSGVLFGG